VPLIPQYGCEPVETPPDCDWLFKIGDRIRLAALSGLEPYLPAVGSPCDPGLRSYVSLGRPPADMCDLLGVWLVNYGPTRRSFDSARAGTGMEWSSEWSVDLWEKCYPGPKEVEGIYSLPDPELLHDINQWVYQHGMAMYHAVVDELLGQPCESIVFANLLPFAPQGGCAGWSFRVTMVA
jgi:hypothetical protein